MQELFGNVTSQLNPLFRFFGILNFVLFFKKKTQLNSNQELFDKGANYHLQISTVSDRSNAISGIASARSRIVSFEEN